MSIKLLHRDKTYVAKAINTDVIKASAEALINGVNSIIIENRSEINE